ncbi:MAG: biotin transporter BioY [Bacillota bacterium]
MANLSSKSPKTRNLTARLTISAIFTALIAILAQFAIPLAFSPVPVTGQTIGVILTALLLDKRTAIISVFAYLLLGAAGAPVFSLTRGGLYMITGPTGGYLWGFLPAVYLASIISGSSLRYSIQKAAVAAVIAMAVIYFCGGLQLALIMGYSPQQTFLVGVLPFLPADLIKAGITVFLALQIYRSLERNKLDHLIRD